MILDMRYVVYNLYYSIFVKFQALYTFRLDLANLILDYKIYMFGPIIRIIKSKELIFLEASTLCILLKLMLIKLSTQQKLHLTLRMKSSSLLQNL